MPIYLRFILLTGPISEGESTATGHAAQVEALRSGGKLLAAGRMRNGEGYVEIFRTADLHEAEALAREDPVIAAGQGTWVLRELESFEL